MNSLSDIIKNYLIVVSSKNYLQQLYKLSLQKVKNGCLVLIITSEFYDFSNLMVELDVDKDHLKNFIIMYYKRIEEISRKLLFLHTWSLLPSMVVVDLSELITADTSNCLTSASLMKKVTFCTVSLLTYLQSVAVQLTGTINELNSLDVINGFLILQSGKDNFGDIQIQNLKNLYFYKTELYQDFVDIGPLLLQKKVEK